MFTFLYHLETIRCFTNYRRHYLYLNMEKNIEPCLSNKIYSHYVKSNVNEIRVQYACFNAGTFVSVSVKTNYQKELS